PDMVSLADELALIEAYLRIEQLRLGDRLTVDWQVEPEARTYLIPTLSLQPLVENAIAHGIARRSDGGLLSIRAQRNGRQLWIRISNPVAPGDDAGRHVKGNRQALRNIEQRL